MPRSLRICVGASSGGHMNQLLKLLDYSADWPAQPFLFITTQPELVSKLSTRGLVAVIGECNRWYPHHIAAVAFRTLRIYLKHRPDVIVTTGSLPIAILCLWAKLFRTKVVWIDSIANSRKFSMSGKLMYPFADLFLTQWQDLALAFPKAEYAGELL